MRGIDIGDAIVKPPADPGSAPMLQWLKIADLVIDESYQRALGKSNWDHIQKIAANFSWSKFSPVFCAPIAGGKYAVIDGQHRAHAAALCGFEDVPAQIVQMSKPEQAAAFSAVNGSTIRVTTWQLFKSALEAGEEWAIAARDVVAAAGCKLMTYNSTATERRAREVYAFLEIRKQINAGKGELVTRALSAISKSKKGSTLPAWHDEVLRPWINAICDRPNLTDVPALARFFDGLDVFGIADRTDAFIRDRRRAGIKCVARHELISGEFGTALDAAFLPATRLKGSE